MDFLELAKKRCSVRRYDSRPVEPEKLRLILEAGRVAPSARNQQPWRILVVQSPEGMAKLGRACNPHGAPMALIVCADREEAWQRPWDGMNSFQIDASIVTDHMMLEAASLGLGSVWICAFKPDVLRQEFQLPDGWEPVNVLPLGYAAGEVSPPDRHAAVRKPLEETVFYETPPEK